MHPPPPLSMIFTHKTQPIFHRSLLLLKTPITSFLFSLTQQTTTTTTTTMSDEETTTPTTATATTTTSFDTHHHYQEKIQSAMQSLSSILPSPLPSPPLSASSSSLHPHISSLLRLPNSGSGDNNLCRWLYDTFQSSVPDLHLLVLRFLPLITGLYLSRIPLKKPQAGFEAILLALYAHETTSRASHPVTITLPDLSHPSIYHESKSPPAAKNNATDLNLAVVSPALEPHGTVRSTRRARIVGVALELFFSKISLMPVESKVDFCKFCKVWAGQDGDMYKSFEGEESGEVEDEEEDDEGDGGGEEMVEVELEEGKVRMGVGVEGRIPLPWELMQPVVRILGHCLMGPDNKDARLFAAAREACRCLFARSMHDVKPMAILATRSLLRLSKSIARDGEDVHPIDLPMTDVISL